MFKRKLMSEGVVGMFSLLSIRLGGQMVDRNQFLSQVSKAFNASCPSKQFFEAPICPMT